MILILLNSRISGRCFLLIAILSMLVLEIETLMRLATSRLEFRGEKSSSLIQRYIKAFMLRNSTIKALDAIMTKFPSNGLRLQGEVAVNRRVDTKSYTSLHTLVHGMFPPMTSCEQV